MLREYLLSVDNFTKPKVVTGMKAVGIIIIRLIELIPGTNPLHPRMGIGLSRYRHITSEQLNELQNVVEEQMSTYLPPEFQATQISLDIGVEQYLKISMIINGVNYQYDTKDSNTPVQLSEVIQK